MQSFAPYEAAQLVAAQQRRHGPRPCPQQLLPLGPAASQIAIKQLGTNGGGFFNVNSVHPYENPTPLANFFELLSILVISGALCYTFGEMVGDTRQGWAILAAMLLIFVPLLFLCCRFGGEWQSSLFGQLDVDQTPECHASRAATWRGRKHASASPLRGVVGQRDHGGLERQRELHARFAHAAWGASCQCG